MSVGMLQLLILIAAVALPKSIECSSIKKVSGIDPFQKIEGESVDYAQHAYSCHDCVPQTGDPATFLCDIYPDTIVGYYDVNFATGAVKINVRLTSWITSDLEGTFSLHLDSPQSLPMLTVPITSTGGHCLFNVMSFFVQVIPTGVRDLYFTFTSSNQNWLMDIDWFYFDATSGDQTNFDAFEIIEAEDFNYTQAAVRKSCPSSSVTYDGDLQNSSVTAYYGVDFGSGPQMVQLRIASWEHGFIGLHLDSALDEPFVTIPIQKVDPEVDSCNFVIFEQFLSTVPTGVHDLYFTFDLPSGVQSFVNIDWFKFKRT